MVHFQMEEDTLTYLSTESTQQFLLPFHAECTLLLYALTFITELDTMH